MVGGEQKQMYESLDSREEARELPVYVGNEYGKQDRTQSDAGKPLKFRPISSGNDLELI